METNQEQVKDHSKVKGDISEELKPKLIEGLDTTSQFKSHIYSLLSSGRDYAEIDIQFTFGNLNDVTTEEIDALRSYARRDLAAVKGNKLSEPEVKNVENLRNIVLELIA